MRLRTTLLLIAACLIGGLCLWKLTRNYPPQSSVAVPMNRPAPRFTLFDQHKPQRLVKLEAYLGRHQILIAFFDGSRPVTEDALVQQLLAHEEALTRRGIKILAISPAIPQVNRRHWEEVHGKDSQPPFPLLSDPALIVHREWGRLDSENTAPAPGKGSGGMIAPPLKPPALFLVDRAGNLPWQATPLPVDDPAQTIADLLN